MLQPPLLLHAAPQSAAAAGISGLLPPPSLPVSDPSSSPHKLFIHPSRGSPRCPCREIRKHICRLHVRRGDLHGRARRGRRQFAAAAGSSPRPPAVSATTRRPTTSAYAAGALPCATNARKELPLISSIRPLPAPSSPASLD